jgi:hypothetical protein
MQYNEVREEVGHQDFRPQNYSNALVSARNYGFSLFSLHCTFLLAPKNKVVYNN